ncbi:MAG: TolC family protein [Armatimonadetes bacterium]|nr:TolC family protein [Armatimonadota bacterium]
MRTTEIVFGLALVMLPCAMSFAADLPSDRPLTLTDCIRHALSNHNNVLAAERDAESSRAATRQARSGYLPRLGVSSGYAQSGYEGGQTGSTQIRTGTFTNDRTILSVTETLYDGGLTRMAIRQAAASERSSIANLELARQQRVLIVTEAYFDALLTSRLADIAAQTVDEAEKQLEMIRAKIDAGDAARVDIYPVEVQLANAKLDRIRADNDVRVAANSLRNAVGLGRGPALTIADVSDPRPDIPTLDASLARAMTDRPEAAGALAQVESAKAGLSYARSQTYPVPTASASYDYGLIGELDNRWSVGVALNLNIWDGGAAQAEVDGSRARLDSVSMKSEQLLRDISAEVEEAHLNVTTAFERLKAGAASVELARTNLEVAKEKYMQEMAIPLEITSAQTAYADARAQHARALYDCYVAQARLDRAVGKRGY